jgi:hypothetical protein
MKYAKIGKDDGSTQLGEHDFEILKLDALDKMFLRKVYRSGNNYFMSVHNTCTWLCISKHTYKRMIKRLQKEGLLKVQQFTYKQSDNTFKSVTQHSVDLVALARFPRVQLLKTEKIYAPETGGQNGTPKDSEQNAPQPEQNAHDDGAKCTGEVSKMHPEGEQNGTPILNPNEGTLKKEPYLFNGEAKKISFSFKEDKSDVTSVILNTIEDPYIKYLVPNPKLYDDVIKAAYLLADTITYPKWSQWLKFVGTAIEKGAPRPMKPADKDWTFPDDAPDDAIEAYYKNILTYYQTELRTPRLWMEYVQSVELYDLLYKVHEETVYTVHDVRNKQVNTFIEENTDESFYTKMIKFKERINKWIAECERKRQEREEQKEKDEELKRLPF